ncbi:MAG: J domain-containing protein [Lachnospiraceae bacterium]|nr:J domain-containing protein [Lachnospiraceae bacterium]MEE3461206.1 J domain-containing protein [Lachnospiraceae bacterium]
MNEKDYYKILGLERNASDNEIKKAFHKLAKKYHPDGNPGNKAAEQKFKEVNEAYAVLGDPKKRKAYDQFGSYAFEGGSAGGGQGTPFDDLFNNVHFGSGGGSREFHFTDGNGTHEFHFTSAGNGGDFNYSGMGNDFFGDIFSDIFGGTGPGTKTGSFGSGPGEGRSQHDSSFWSDTNSQKFSNERKPYGSGFERMGNDLYTTVYVPFPTAVLGGEVKIRTLNGAVMCRIKPGTQSGTRIRLRGKGLSDTEGKTGDEYAEVRIEVPENLSEHSKNLLREFEDSLGNSRVRH